MSPGNVEDRPPEVRVANPPVERVGRIMEKLLDTADVAKVFGEPIAHGQLLLIPAAEIVAVAGVGLGSGGRRRLRERAGSEEPGERGRRRRGREDPGPERRRDRGFARRRRGPAGL